MRVLIVLLLICTSTFSEYRVYQYIIKDKTVVSASKLITSTLNPRAYLSYNGIQGLNLDLVRTWICPGYTGNKKEKCKSPYEKMINKEL